MKKTALVTGGNRGIGLAICKGLHAAGIEVILTARDASEAAAAAAQIGCRSIALDVGEAGSFANVASKSVGLTYW